MLAQLPPPLHGVTIVNRSILESALLTHRFDFQVIPLRFASDIADLRHVRFGKVLRTLVIALRLADALATHRPALVYFTLCPSGAAFLRDLLFVGVIKAFGVPRIFHLHGRGVREASARNRLLRALYSWGLGNADVIHLSRALFSDVQAFVPEERLFAVPNGILGPEIQPRRQRHSEQTTTIAFISSMLAAKGPLVLLEALSLLEARGVAFCAEFAGPWREPATRQSFERSLCRGNLSQRVRYLGVVAGPDKHAFFLRADVLAYPTLSDAFPLVAVEAMAYGLPVVASREGALVEIVEEEKTGCLVPPNDPVALADTLQRLIQDPRLRECMGKAGRRRYEQNYRREIFESMLADVLETCIARSPALRTSTGMVGS